MSKILTHQKTDVAFICPSHGHWRDLAVHIVTSLSLPQFSVITEADSYLETSIHIIFGPEGWRPDRLGSTYGYFTSDMSGGLDVSKDQPQRKLLFAPHAGNNKNVSSTTKINTRLFWAVERLRKGQALLSLDDIAEWLLFIFLSSEQLNLQPDLTKVILSSLRRREAFPQFLSKVDKLIKEQKLSKIPTILEQLKLAMMSSEKINPDKITGLSTARKSMLRAPSLVIIHALDLASNDANLENSTEYLENLLPHCKTARRLLSVYIAAYILGNKQICETIALTMNEEAWRRSDTCLLRSTYAAPTSLCYSPFSALSLILGESEKLDDDILISYILSEPIEIPKPNSLPKIGSTGTIGRASFKISRSLINSWKQLHTAPISEGQKYLLSDENYKNHIYKLEELWVQSLRLILQNSGCPLVRMAPWPYGKTSALSLRYDVDRPVSNARIIELAELQLRKLKAHCATWYYFETDQARHGQFKVLTDMGQFSGLHLQSANAAETNIGITHHSAPTSDYWLGDLTLRTLNAKSVLYGEFLAGQIVTPRPAWISVKNYTGDDTSGKIGQFWLTPLHFPLEGATNETTLAYFDQLLLFFRDQIKNGGHVIIGSHPDLNQDILETLIDREMTSDIWVAPIENVIKRCQSIKTYQNITAFTQNEKLNIVTNKDIEDLAIRYYSPSCEQPMSFGMNFKAGDVQALPLLSPNTLGRA